MTTRTESAERVKCCTCGQLVRVEHAVVCSHGSACRLCGCRDCSVEYLRKRIEAIEERARRREQRWAWLET